MDVGTDITFEELKTRYDCLYLAIGAHTDKKTGIEGENSQGVMSAVELLRGIGDGDLPDFTGKQVVVIGGGNVAMDVTRSAIRLGADKVFCVYRRRKEDMTALPEEVEGADGRGCRAPDPPGPCAHRSRRGGPGRRPVDPAPDHRARGQRRTPAPHTADVPQVRLAADLIIVAIGQGIETHGFEQSGVKIQRGGTILADSSSQLDGAGGRVRRRRLRHRPRHRHPGHCRRQGGRRQHRRVSGLPPRHRVRCAGAPRPAFPTWRPTAGSTPPSGRPPSARGTSSASSAA